MFKKLGHKLDVFFRWVSIWITRIWKFMTHDVFLLNEKSFSSWKARLVRDAKTVLLMINTFSSQKIGYQVTALAYRSMMSVVPAIAIGFYLTDGLGLREKFEQILVNNLRDTEIVDQLLQAADNIVQTAESGLFGFISMASFVWIVLSLMIMVRQVFNNVWKVEQEPNFLKMMGVILGITILAPFVIIIFFSGSVVYSHVLDLLFPSKLFFSDHLKNFLSWTLFAGIVVLILYVMYKYVPGTHVHSRHSFKAAIISGILFVAVQYLYRYLYSKLTEQCTSPSLRYIRDHFDLPVTVEYLAKLEKYNVNYYTDWFKRRTGMSPGTYLRNVRIRKAKEYLSESGYGLTDIAVMVGYSSNATFTRAFHTVTGMTPKEYRNCDCFRKKTG